MTSAVSEFICGGLCFFATSWEKSPAGMMKNAGKMLDKNHFRLYI
jgi:hypothetical protein